MLASTPALSRNCAPRLRLLLLHSYKAPSCRRPAGRPLRWLTAKLQVPVTPAAPVSSIPARRGATAHGCPVRPALARRTPLRGRMLARLVRALPRAVSGAAARLLSWAPGTLAARRPLALPSIHWLRAPRAAPPVLAARRSLALATPVLPSARVHMLLPIVALRGLAAPRPMRVPSGAARRRRGRGRHSGGLRRRQGPMAAACSGCKLR